jgi:hypothetical protein
VKTRYLLQIEYFGLLKLVQLLYALLRGAFMFNNFGLLRLTASVVARLRLKKIGLLRGIVFGEINA